MAKSKKQLHEEIRNHYMQLIKDFLTTHEEEVLNTNSNEFALPCVDSEGNDEFLVITFKVPTGSRDGEAYDGYGEAQSYSMKVADKTEKARVAAEKKAAKIAKDQKMREEKAKAKAAHTANSAAVGSAIIDASKNKNGT